MRDKKYYSKIREVIKFYKAGMLSYTAGMRVFTIIDLCLMNKTQRKVFDILLKVMNEEGKCPTK